MAIDHVPILFCFFSLPAISYSALPDTIKDIPSVFALVRANRQRPYQASITPTSQHTPQSFIPTPRTHADGQRQKQTLADYADGGFGSRLLAKHPRLYIQYVFLLQVPRVVFGTRKF